VDGGCEPEGADTIFSRMRGEQAGSGCTCS
jgi:hypothetical protein